MTHHNQGVLCVSNWLTNQTRGEFVLTNIISGPEPAELWLKIGEIETFGRHTNWQTHETKLFTKHYFRNTDRQLKEERPRYYMVKIYISIIYWKGLGTNTNAAYYLSSFLSGKHLWLCSPLKRVHMYDVWCVKIGLNYSVFFLLYKCLIPQDWTIFNILTKNTGEILSGIRNFFWRLGGIKPSSNFLSALRKFTYANSSHIRLNTLLLLLWSLSKEEFLPFSH